MKEPLWNWVEHKGKRILYVDYRRLKSDCVAVAGEDTVQNFETEKEALDWLSE